MQRDAQMHRMKKHVDARPRNMHPTLSHEVGTWTAQTVYLS